MANNKHDSGILEKVARTIGSAAGTVAAKTGLAEHDEHGKPSESRSVTGKYKKSGKKRLPRKVKKLNGRKKAAA